jgi:hypothetical protein
LASHPARAGDTIIAANAGAPSADSGNFASSPPPPSIYARVAGSDAEAGASQLHQYRPHKSPPHLGKRSREDAPTGTTPPTTRRLNAAHVSFADDGKGGADSVTHDDGNGSVEHSEVSSDSEDAVESAVQSAPPVINAAPPGAQPSAASGAEPSRSLSASATLKTSFPTDPSPEDIVAINNWLERGALILAVLVGNKVGLHCYRKKKSGDPRLPQFEEIDSNLISDIIDTISISSSSSTDANNGSIDFVFKHIIIIFISFFFFTYGTYIEEKVVKNQMGYLSTNFMETIKLLGKNVNEIASDNINSLIVPDLSDEDEKAAENNKKVMKQVIKVNIILY